MTLSKKNGGKVMEQNKKRYEADVFRTFKLLGYDVEIKTLGDVEFTKKLDWGVLHIYLENDDGLIYCFVKNGDNVEPTVLNKVEFELLHKLCRLRGWWYE